MNKRNHLLAKTHLVISVIIVVPVAFIYGFQFDSLLDFQLDTLDELNQFKAMMGFYLGFSMLWILGIFKANYLKTAIITNMIFMLGMGFGRIVSFVYDGLPSPAYVYGTIGELVLGFYSLWVLTSKRV